MSDPPGTAQYFLRRNWTEPWVYPYDCTTSFPEGIPPWISRHQLPFEKLDQQQAVAMMEQIRRNHWWGPAAAAIYLLFIWLGPRIMQRRKAFDMRPALKWWNFALFVFSTVATVRMVPELFWHISRRGLSSMMCTPPISMACGNIGIWTFAFAYSKFAELFDTAFIVFRKKRLSFLHWYHHVTVMLFTWAATGDELPLGILFCAMNYFVHSVMYFYYYLAAASPTGKPPSWGKIVTILQISQMIVGVGLTGLAAYLMSKYEFKYFWPLQAIARPLEHGACYINPLSVIGACLMYLTYFYLFAVFFYERYWGKKPARDLKKTN
eukprot:Polyplicarium_translucidae@DN2407_c0_g1_i1.p2